MRKTPKPDSSLWKVTRSTLPVRVSSGFLVFEPSDGMTLMIN
jgi:hypothetical protein